MSTQEPTSPLKIELRDGVAHLRLARPHALNAINPALGQALEAASAQLAGDPAVRVVVLSGEGKAFMAGGDLHALRADPLAAVEALIPPFHQAVRTFAEMPKPVIAAIHGAAAGAGMSLALAADLTIAAEGTRLVFAYSDIGTCSDGGMSWHLVRRVGLARATEIAWLGEPLDASQAQALGLVSQVVPADQLLATADALARRLAQREPHALGQLKALLRTAGERTLPQQLDAEYAAFRDCAAQPGFTAAIDAFFARKSGARPPNT